MEAIETSGTIDVNLGGSSQLSLTRGFEAEAHAGCDLRWHGGMEDRTTYGQTEKLSIDIDSAYQLGEWKLVFQVTLRSAKRGSVFHWTSEAPSVRLKGLGINRAVPFDNRHTPLADVRFNRPLVLDFVLPCDDEVLFRTLARHQHSLEADLAVELPAGFPLADEGGKPVTDSMILGDEWSATAPALISLTFGPATCFSPWSVRPQTADGRKLPVTLRMALESIQRDIEQEPTLPNDVFRFDEAEGLESVCGVPFGKISFYQDGTNTEVRVVPLMCVNNTYYSSVPADILDKELGRFSGVEFVGRCIDSIADLAVEKLSLWSQSDREALLQVLDREITEDMSDESAGRAAARLRLADSNAMVRFQGAMALDKLAQGKEGELFEILYRMHMNGRLADVQEEQVKRWTKGAAKFGDAQAQFDEGRNSTKERNYKDAFSWIKKAAEQGHSEAQRVLGDFYLNGRGVKRNASQAAKWYGKSMTPEARASLGRLRVRGEGGRQNKEQGVELIADAANSGNPYAQAQLGLRYKFGEAKSKKIHWWTDDETSEKENAEEALKWFRKSAAQNNSYGLARLGVCYRDGYGVESNAAEAVRLFRKAIEHDTEYWGEYQRLLGKCYRDGTGVEKDVAEAARLFREAAELGDSEGQYCLGVCYLNGTGVEKNGKEGRKWLEDAANNGNENAKEKLRSLSKK